ncbi:MAG: hypothetical protein RL375_2942 [Pseudomonadota bacterium]
MSGSARQRWRERWRRVHLWLGLSLGTLLALLGLSGSVLVFYTEIDAVLEPALRWQERDGRVQRWEPVLQALQQAHPERERGWRIELPPGGAGIVTARYLKPVERSGEFFAPLLVSVHPTSHQVLATRFWGDFAMTWLYDLHFSLLAGESGRTVVGVAGSIGLVSLVSGVVLWWPRSTSQWRQAWRFKTGAAPARRTWDQHRLGGIYGLVLLALLTLTGVVLALPQWVDPLLAPWTAPAVSPRPRSTPPADGSSHRLSLDQALAAAHARFPQAAIRWVDTPDGPTGTYRMRMQQPGEPSARFPRTLVWIDAYSGRVLAEQDARRLGRVDTVMAWVHPLHNGEALGLAGRLTAAAAGLLLPVLWVTGLMRWRDRRRGSAAAAARRTLQAAAH